MLQVVLMPQILCFSAPSPPRFLSFSEESDICLSSQLLRKCFHMPFAVEPVRFSRWQIGSEIGSGSQYAFSSFTITLYAEISNQSSKTRCRHWLFDSVLWSE